MKKRLICIILAVALLTSVIALTAVFAEDSKQIPSSGNLGEKFDLPTIVDGQTVTARIIAPSGKTYSAKRLELTEIGQYTVEYYNSNGDLVYTKHCVAVRRSTDMFSTNNYAKIKGIDTYKYTTAKTLTGVKVEVSTGASITLEREIDMTNRTKNDVLTSIVVEPTVGPQKTDSGTVYSRDFGRMILTYTDVEDPSVYFTVITTSGNQDTKGEGGRAYIRAGGNGQLAGGYEEKGGTFEFNTTDIYGARAPFSFQAKVLNNDPSKYEFALKLCYDSEENALYLPNGEANLYGKPYRIVDFDEVSNFGTNVWTGFPSGRAKLTVTFDYFINKTGNVIITEADGIDFSKESLVDDQAPEINVDMNGELSAPNSFIGATYKIFDATAKDFFDLSTKVSTSVYYVDGENRLDVNVQNGAFVTNRVGKYEIVYTSTDKSGNTATKTVELYCVHNHNDITFKGIEESMDVSVFDTVSLTPADDVRCTGGNGLLTRSLTVYSPTNEVVPLIDNSFVPTTIGVYRVEYKATDFFGKQGIAVINVNVGATDQPIFVGKISLPDVLINGFTYNFPAVSAKKVVDGAVVDAPVRYYVDEQEVTNGKFTVNATGKIRVECRTDGKDGNPVVIYKDVYVVDGNKGLAQQNYFYSADGSVSSTLEKDNVALNVSADGITSFANKLGNGQFKASFSYMPTQIGFSSIDVIVSSANDTSKSVTFNVTFSSMGLTVSTKDLSSVNFPLKSDATNNYFAIGYTDATRTFTDVNDKAMCVLKTYDDGTEFNGFDGGIYMSIKFNSVKKASQLFVTAINNQSFGYKYSIDDPAGDINGPQIIINGTYNRRQDLGSTLTLYTADAFDVLNQVSTFTLSVYDPDNVAVLSNVSPDKLYTLQLDKIGRYRIVYSAKDTSGNNKVTNAGTTLTVVDIIQPKLEVNSKIKELYAVGSKIKLPKFTVSDNTENVYCDVYLLLPNNETRLLLNYVNGETTSYLVPNDPSYPPSFKADETSFYAETAGKYVLTYLAYDDSFNYVRHTIEFTVVEKESK